MSRKKVIEIDLKKMIVERGSEYLEDMVWDEKSKHIRLYLLPNIKDRDELLDLSTAVAEEITKLSGEISRLRVEIAKIDTRLKTLDKRASRILGKVLDLVAPRFDKEG